MPFLNASALKDIRFLRSENRPAAFFYCSKTALFLIPLTFIPLPINRFHQKTYRKFFFVVLFCFTHAHENGRTNRQVGPAHLALLNAALHSRSPASPDCCSGQSRRFPDHFPTRSSLFRPNRTKNHRGEGAPVVASAGGCKLSPTQSNWEGGSTL